jgi:hypothetical protein
MELVMQNVMARRLQNAFINHRMAKRDRMEEEEAYMDEHHAAAFDPTSMAGITKVDLMYMHQHDMDIGNN